jgi:hypothetical protein
MAVELTVRLVSDDPNQLNAFNNPTPNGGGGLNPPIPPLVAPPIGGPPPPPLQAPPIVTQGGTDLADIAKMLKEALEKSTKPKAEKVEPTPARGIAGVFDKMDASIQKTLDNWQMRNTRSGAVISNLSTYAKRTATRLANFGRPVAAAAGAAATGASGAAAGSAAGAAAGAAGTAAIVGGGTIAAPIIAAAVAAAGAAISLKLLSDAVHSVANDLSDLSPEVAKTQAAFQLNMELARLDRAQRTGAGIAQLEAARNRISESMYEIQTKILEILIKFAPLIEGVLDGINVGIRSIDVIISTLNHMWSIINDLPIFGGDLTDNAKAQADLQNSLAELAKAVSEFLGTNRPPANTMDPFLAELLAVQGPRANRPNNGPRAPRGALP